MMDMRLGALSPASPTPEKRPTCTVFSVPLGNPSVVSGAEGIATPAPTRFLGLFRGHLTHHFRLERDAFCLSSQAYLAASRHDALVRVWGRMPLRAGFS